MLPFRALQGMLAMSVDAKASPRTVLETTRARVREFFLMQDARTQATRLPAAKAGQLRAWHAAAQLRIRHADELQGPFSSAVAFVLYRDALRLLARASLIDESPDAVISDEAALEAVPRFLETVPEASRGALADAFALVRQSEPLAFDGIPEAEIATKRVGVEELLRWLAGRVEARTERRILNVRGLRWAGVALVAAFMLRVLISAVFSPPNVALHKVVTASSHYPGTPEPSALVDGVWDKLGVHTTVESTPWVLIDLGGTYTVRSIRVRNRPDGFFDEGLPLIVETAGTDGAFVVAGERTVHYDAWDVDVGGKSVAKVRLRVPHHGYIALAEVEVYADRR